ncbi:MAG: type II toxin-antitoxin system VapC family toxin [Actinophytocola sp.]|nr:type II toxin-antitoxin system VapC family toxin [Actinophytocola sp.]
MAERHRSGVLATSTYIDLALLDPECLPEVPELTSITMAELHQGVAMAKDDRTRAARTEKLAAALVEFEPLPFDGEAAARFGTMVSLTLAAGRDPKPRRVDLMIAAVASTRGTPLYTRNEVNFTALAEVLTVVAV